ncbi:MAG: DNA recombination/repair protein RecA, partial [Erysipelotrichaceae bacterium]|nr:DNA recombination/repair protein RecA [Erysipelotrichaceae bacterium]
DSVAALVPKAEIEGLMGDNNSMGLQARLMSKAMRKLAGILNKSNCLIIFINQLREKISSGPMYGNPETTTGGRALKFYASVRIDIRRKEALKVRENNEEKIVGNLVQVKVVKNKVAPPFKSCEITIIFGRGISKEDEIIDLAVERGLILKSGSWYQYKDEKIGQGKENVKKYLSLHENVQNEIVTALENGEAR